MGSTAGLYLLPAENNLLYLPEIEPWFVGHPARGAFTIIIALFRLLTYLLHGAESLLRRKPICS
jgi:hypothetical protein